MCYGIFHNINFWRKGIIMYNYYWVCIVLLIVFVIFKKLIKILIKYINGDNEFPYTRKIRLLTATELHFYEWLREYLPENQSIFVDVSLKDFIKVSNEIDKKDRLKYQNKIDKKHVDFLICEKKTTKILFAIELDDKSHNSEKRKKRDEFVDNVYRAAAIKLIHIKPRKNYTKDFMDKNLNIKEAAINQISETKLTNIKCPKCGGTMSLRKATKGKNSGKQFYGCSNYPKCREIIEISAL